MDQLSGKIAIVTGATKGIGRAIAEALLGVDIRVCIAARNQLDIDKALSDLEEKYGSKITGVACDVRRTDQVKSLFARTIESFDGLDILVNNAGIGIFKTVEETTPDEFRAVLETNLFGVFHCCREAIPLMKTRGGGYIINISSLAGANPHPKWLPTTRRNLHLTVFPRR